MWRKHTVSLIGCGLLMWGWIETGGVLVLTPDITQIPIERVADRTAGVVRVASPELYTLSPIECTAENRQLQERIIGAKKVPVNNE